MTEAIALAVNSLLIGALALTGISAQSKCMIEIGL